MKKNKIKKGLSLLCAIGMFVGMLAGCGVNEAEGVETFTMWTNSATPFEEEQVAKFNETIGKENGIKLELTNYGDDYSKTVEMAIANGSAPDFYKIQGALSSQVQKGNLFPVSDLPGMEDFLAEYDGMLMEYNEMIDGKVYRVPGRRNLFAMLYNKDLFKKAGIVDENGEAKPPKTWDEVVEYAKILTNPNESTYGIIFPMKWSGFWGTEITPVMTANGQMNFDRKTQTYDYSIYKPILEKVMQIKADGTYFPGSEGLDNDAARAQFATGRVGMKMGVSWDVYVLNDQFPAECQWGVCTIPKLNESDPDYYQHSTTESLMEISSSVKDKDLNKVALIYKWYCSDERIGELYEQALLFPAKASVVEKYSPKVEKQGLIEFAELIKASNYSAPSTGYALKYEGETIAQVFDKVWAEMLTIDKAVTQLTEDYQEAYDSMVASGEYAEQIETYTNLPDEMFDRTLPEEIKAGCALYR